MCGIVGYAGRKPVVDFILRGLKALEYRGYDSAGVAYFEDGSIAIEKSEGKLTRLLDQVKSGPGAKTQSTCGMGHTRWATHGKPTTQNAHPHRAEHVVLIHNGIIENYLEIRDEILAQGYRPTSETDSELFGYLVLNEMKRGLDLESAVWKSFGRVRGSCTFLVMSEKEPGKVVALCRGMPLVAALDKDGAGVLASDAQPLLEFTQDVIFLESGDGVVATAEGLRFVDFTTGRPLTRKATRLNWTAEQVDKRGYPHYFLKEIHEMPTAIVDTLNGILDRTHADPFTFQSQPGVEILKRAKALALVACGTSHYSTVLGKYWLEKWTGLPVTIETASEFRYRDPALPEGTVVVGVSQSGETADTLAVIHDMKARGVPTLAITNVRGSTITRTADATFALHAGPEICVLSTKTFAATNAMFLVWAGCLGLARGRKELGDIFQQLVRLPHLVEAHLREDSAIVRGVQKTAQRYHAKKGFFFIGRGYSFPVSLEGALKLKECAYIHAEGYPAGELKHGPIAMIDSDMVVVVIAPEDRWREKTISNLQEVKARGANIVGIGHAGDAKMAALCDEWLPFDAELDPELVPFVTTPIVHRFAYEVALLKGTNIDQPRNLAKSVTVE